MLSTTFTETSSRIFPNTISHYHSVIRRAAEKVASQRGHVGIAELPFRIPEPDEMLRDFYAVSDISVHELDSVGGRRVTALNLMRNPGTRTTKTFASLSMVARAAQHIRDTGERIMIVTPTSGNKGTALRDAVARAYATGLATPAELRVLTITPADSLLKLRDCPLAVTTALRAANPAVVADVARPAQVKEIARGVVDAYLADPSVDGWRIWHTLDLDNYRVADVVRTCVEAEYRDQATTGRPVWHVHAVSSAYGLLGYSLGCELLCAAHPGFFLVQHLATPDMVLSLSGARLPRYRRDAGSGLWRQAVDPRFPQVADSAEESIDPTFYTQAPVTSAQIDALIREHGGGGVVVSKRECLERYDQVRELAAPLDADLPCDPAELREWALVMALTGLVIADERALVPPNTDIVMHASGCYTDKSLPPANPAHVRSAAGEQEALAILREALR